jgi:glycerate dehydrogenase
MNIVFLDSDSLPRTIARPTWGSSWIDRPSTRADELVLVASHADALITNKVRIGRAELAQLPLLRFICVAATGYDCIDLAACREFGVVVSNVPAYSAHSVAESVITSIFALRRQLFSYRDAARHDWSTSAHFCVHKAPIKDVRGSVLGIIGKGDIGTATARLAEAVGMQVIYAEHRHSNTTRPGYQPFYSVLAESDVITLHCPLNELTRGLIGTTELARMKPGAVLINTARGPLLDETAVLQAFNSGHLGGAALDVLSSEPPPQNHPLLSTDLANLIVTPHVAWASQSSLQRLADEIVGNLQAFGKGAPINQVT